MRMAPHDLSGTALGGYKLQARLGAGGMGEVYRARDTRLNRTVAIKLLPSHRDADAHWRDRFHREAQVLAALNHPNIAAIYGFEEANGVPFLIMELVGGDTLERRIGRGPIAVDESLTIASRIAEALEDAHERGIVHRDLKPSNIAFTVDGQVKVLDFGLAKFAAAPITANAVDDASIDTMSPDLTAGAGVLLGTPGYLSPEQINGREADKRSDIWAFGCVLFEMITGRRPFEGDTVAELLAASLKQEVTFPAHVPSAVQHLIRRCVQKLPQKRFRDIGDVRLEIEDILAGPSPSLNSGAPPERWRWRAAIGGAVGIVIGAAITVGVESARNRAVDPPTARLSIPTAGAAALAVSGYGRDVAVSPDGRLVVYVSGNGTELRLRPLAEGNSRVLQGLGIPHHPFFSPDGAWIAYFDGSFAIRKVSINGGPPLTICQLASAPTGGAWGPDNTIVFVTANLSLGLLQVSANGGEPKTITVPQEDFFNGVTFVPNGKAVLYNARKSGGPLRVVAFDLTSRAHKTVVREGSDARVLPSKQLVYGVNGTIQLSRFDPDTLEPAEGPIALSDAVLVTPFGGLLNLDVSRNGTLVYVPANEASSERLLVWVDRQGNEEPIAAPARAYTYPRMAPDDSRVAIDVRDGESDIWFWDFRRLALTRFTFGPAFDQYPTWADGGARLVFDSTRDGVANLFWHATTGGGSADALSRSPNPQFPHAISPDGKLLVFREETRDTGQDLFLMTLRDRRVQPLLHSASNESNAEISPDGRWLAYESNESGDYEVLVRPFPEVSAGRWQVSSGGGHKPLWARDGKELFYVSNAGALMSVKAEPGTTFAVSAPAKVIDGGRYYVGSGINGGRTYDISRDGKRFLMLKARPNVSTNLAIVQNWFAELERLTPVAAR